MSTGSAVGLSGDVRLLRTLKTVLPALNLKLLAPPAPVPDADEASPAEIRVALIDQDYPDTAAVLKWLEPERRIPVILMRDENVFLSRTLRGAAAVLGKPLDPNKLRAAVELVVPDWEDSSDREPRLADILDLFDARRPASEPADDPMRETPRPGPEPEDEIDRILGPALAEIGIPAVSFEAPPPSPLGLPRLPDPPPLRPKPLPPPFPSGPRKAPPAAVSPSFRRPFRPEPAAGEGDAPFAAFGTSPDKGSGRSRRILLVAGLALAVLIGAAYLGFGRKALNRPPAAAESASPVEKAASRTERPQTPDERTFLAATSSPQKPAEETRPAEMKSDPGPTPPSAVLPKRSLEKSATEREPTPPAEVSAFVPAKPEPEANPPAAKDDGPLRIKTDPPPAASKPTWERGPGPEPVKSGDLVDPASVDIPPVLRNSVEPIYPPLAYRNKQEAKVTLRILISEKGAILEAEPGAAPGDDPGFVKAALRAVRRWSYAPAFKNGVAVRVWKTLIIDFRIR